MDEINQEQRGLLEILEDSLSLKDRNESNRNDESFNSHYDEDHRLNFLIHDMFFTHFFP